MRQRGASGGGAFRRSMSVCAVHQPKQETAVRNEPIKGRLDEAAGQVGGERWLRWGHAAAPCTHPLDLGALVQSRVALPLGRPLTSRQPHRNVSRLERGAEEKLNGCCCCRPISVLSVGPVAGPSARSTARLISGPVSALQECRDVGLPAWVDASLQPPQRGPRPGLESVLRAHRRGLLVWLDGRMECRVAVPQVPLRLGVVGGTSDL